MSRRLLLQVAGGFALCSVSAVFSVSALAQVESRPLAVAVRVRGPISGTCNRQAIQHQLHHAARRFGRCVDGADGSWTAKVGLAPGKVPEIRQVQSSFVAVQQRCIQARVLRVLAESKPAACLLRVQVNVTRR